MNLCVFLIVSVVVERSFCVIYHLDDEEHERMPPTFSVDPYAECLRRPGGRYCTAYGTYVADGHSPLLTMMQEYSEHTCSHFNHTRALFGTCLTQKCKDIKEKTLATRIFLEECLNRTVWNVYRLKVKVDQEVYCHGYGEKQPDIGAVDIAVAAISLALIICNVVGSLFDFFFRNHDGLVVEFLQCFSIFRNWKILTAPTRGSNPKLERFKGINGLRVILTTGVIVVHGLLPGILTTENTKFIEDLYDTMYFHVLLNGPLIMQVFLFLSGFLLINQCLMYTETHKVSWKLLPMGILKRWLRLTPSYALVLAFTTTWLPRLNAGPIWDHVVVSESEACRRDWWQHLVYVNNYYEPMCMPHTWYLATDIQLYCVGLVIFVCFRSVAARTVALAALFFAGLLAPALHTYYQDLDGPLIVSPAAGVTLFTTDRTYNIVYKQAHNNVPSYVLGLAAGYLVHSLQRDNFEAAKYKKWRPLYWLLFPSALAMLVACKLFYTTPRVGLLYRVAAAALLKPVFGLLFAAIILGAIFKMDKYYRWVLEWDVWVPFSRVSYSAYLTHLTYVRATSGITDHPLRASYLRTGEMILFTVTMVYLAAYLFWLTVEAPLAQVVKTCFQLNSTGEKNIEALEKSEHNRTKL